MYREEVICRYVKDKDVLDCGGVDHDALGLKGPRGDWLHAIVARHAKSCIGVDILRERVEEISSRGDYTFLVADAEALPFEGQFDVVVAGELVEHVYNVGLFLDSAWRALREDGVLIATTPNAYALSSTLYASVLGRERCHPEHTCYYSPQTLSYVVTHHGFTVEELLLLPRPARWRVVKWFRWVACKFRPIMHETLVLVARKDRLQEKYGDKW